MGLFDRFKKSNTNCIKENKEMKDNYEYVPKKIDENNLKEEMIECYDAYGRKMLISKTEWLNKVLPDQIQKHWNEPTELYNDILLAIKDGLTEFVIDAAQHLKEIDNIKERAYVILSIVYMKVDRNSDAQTLLEDYIHNYNKTGTVLTNLAKTYEAQGQHQKCLTTLWEGLQIDPNQENGLAWWLAIKNEEGGTEVYLHALHEASNLPGSYLPQLYLARNYLKRKDFDTALEIYSKIMEGYSHKDEVLFMASGDMGQAGLVKEMIDLVSPFYDASRNNERIGFNLLQGYLVIKNIQDGNKLISRMMQLDRPDLKQYLLSISDEFEKMEDCSYRNDIKGTPQFEMCSLNKPVWHYGLGEVEYLNIPSKENTTMKIGILVYTSSGDVKGMETRTERETNLGRLTRSIPLFISELLYYYTDCKTITFVPIIREVGPVLSGSEWHDDMLMQMARSNGLMWIVTGNVAMDHDELCIMTKLINVLDNTTENIKDSMHLKNMGNPIKNHVSKIFKSITQMQIADRSSDLYGIPNAENLMEYLNSLGQSLTQTLVVNGIVPFKNMYGERNIINDYIMCCKHMQSIQQMPVIMVSGFAKSKEYGSTVYAEFKDQAIKVIRDYEERMGINEEIVEMVKNL